MALWTRIEKGHKGDHSQERSQVLAALFHMDSELRAGSLKPPTAILSILPF